MSYHDSLDIPMVCQDRYCPKSFDPQRNVVMCRCYQRHGPSPTTETASIGRSTPTVPGSLHYGDNQTVPQPIPNYQPYMGYGSSYDSYGMCQSMYPQMSPNMTSPDLSMYSGSQAMPNYAHAVQMDQMLRSQVSDFWNYQQLNNQVNGNDIPATKQSTKVLKTWLRGHKKNPYPSKTEKVMLAFATRMTMTQISNWFANARRRMKQQKDKGNTSDGALSDISDDDDKGSVSSASTPVSGLSAGSYPQFTHDYQTNYFQEKEILPETHKAASNLYTENKTTKEPVESKIQLISKMADTVNPPTDAPNKSKIWSVASMLC